MGGSSSNLCDWDWSSVSGTTYAGRSVPPPYASTAPAGKDFYYWNDPTTWPGERFDTGMVSGPCGSVSPTNVTNLVCPANGEYALTPAPYAACGDRKYSSSYPLEATPPFTCSYGGATCADEGSAHYGCRWAGTSLGCKRTSFGGDPTSCCFLNGGRTTFNPKSVAGVGPESKMSGACPADAPGYTAAPDNCGMYTCDPAYRDWNGTACVDLIRSYCSNPAHAFSWLPATETSPEGMCSMYLRSNPLSDSGYTVLSSAISGLLSPNGGFAVNTTDPVGAPALASLFSFCPSFGDACSKTLGASTSPCATFTRQEVLDAAEAVAKAPPGTPDIPAANLIAGCGCYLPASQYLGPSSIPGVTYGQTNACDPLCQLPGAVSRTGGGSGLAATAATCKQNVCSIDNIALSIAEGGNVSGNINFDMICPAAMGGGSTACVFSGGTVSILSSGEVPNINFSQSCSRGCFLRDPTNPNNMIPINCANGQKGGLVSSEVLKESSFGSWFSAHKGLAIGGIVLIVLALVALGIGIFLVFRKKPTPFESDSSMKGLGSGTPDSLEV